MKLKLKRPLVVFDLETTGINVSKDRIVEISLLKIGLLVPDTIFIRFFYTLIVQFVQSDFLIMDKFLP